VNSELETLEFRVHADTHKFNARPNISTDTVHTTENPVIYEPTYPTSNPCSYTRTLTGHRDLRYSKSSADNQKTRVYNPISILHWT